MLITVIASFVTPRVILSTLGHTDILMHYQIRKDSHTGMRFPFLSPFYLYHHVPLFVVLPLTNLTSRFVLNGLVNANRILGKEVFVPADWRVIGEYVHDVDGGRHQAFYAPVREIEVLGERIQPHERVQIEQSVKYSPAEASYLWRSAGMAETYKWQNDGKEHGTYWLTRI